MHLILDISIRILLIFLIIKDAQPEDSYDVPLKKEIHSRNHRRNPEVYSPTNIPVLPDVFYDPIKKPINTFERYMESYDASEYNEKLPLHPNYDHILSRNQREQPRTHDDEELDNTLDGESGEEGEEIGGMRERISSTKDPSIPVNPAGLNDPSVLLGEWEEEPLVRQTQSYFKGQNGSQVNAQVGTTAKIPCVVLNRADHETVSFIRLRDHHIITVGRQTYSSDERFSITYRRMDNEWTLHLRYAQPRDAGAYACQVSTHPPMVFVQTLAIVEATSHIKGAPEIYVHEGSEVKLHCQLNQHTEPPEYVFWYHNRTMINFISGKKLHVDKQSDGGILTLVSVGRNDSGNYTCQPANSTPATINLHIILGKPPEAMVSGCPAFALWNKTYLLIMAFQLYLASLRT